MCLSVRPSRQVPSRPISRIQSFAGVLSHNRSFRSRSVFSPACVRTAPAQGSRMFTLSAKSPPPKVPQPERLDELYEALKRGLQAYLQFNQLDLENLNLQMKESKRNSRLGFLYELDKQVKMIERLMRRLEFHLSKMEELYEGYCMQRRLRDGADKMVKAYTASPGSREAKDSLSEANKGFREYTENMCMLESELENQLGEFHVKMKGLAGFARLCAGDQYEIFMKYGRQRWKLRGRMEINGKQVWDSEETLFQPLITDFLSIKVTELKSLANNVVVGNVSCETKDLFTPHPQTVAVDINDLGTIKLNLEVTWNPFDKDDQSWSATTVNKAPTVNKWFSTYNQSPPDTPSLREQAFYNMLRRQEEMENGMAWSNSSESSDDSYSPQLSLGMRHAHKTLVQPEVQVAAPIIEISFIPRESGRQEEEEEEDPEKPMLFYSRSCYTRPLRHITESSTDVALTDRSTGQRNQTPEVPYVIPAVDDLAKEMPLSPEVEPPTAPTSLTFSVPPLSVEEEEEGKLSGRSSPASEEWAKSELHMHPAVVVGKESEDTGAGSEVKPEDPGAGSEVKPEDPGDCGLEEAWSAVVSSLEDLRGQFPELQVLEQELRRLEGALSSQIRRRASSGSLTVEIALGSFDFLNNSDLDDDDDDDEEEEEEEVEEEEKVNVNTVDSETHDSLSQPEGEDVREDEGFPAARWRIPAGPLSTGSPVLDQALLVHLRNCSSQLLRLGMFGPLRCGEMYALDHLQREVPVLELIRKAAEGSSDRVASLGEVVPQLGQCQGAVSLWEQCTDPSGVYSTSAQMFLRGLTASYTSRLPGRAASLADTVFAQLTERVLGRRLPRRGGGASRQTVTVFQFWSYLKAEGVNVLETHVCELAEEVWLLQCLRSRNQDTVLKALKIPAGSSLTREEVRSVGLLLQDPRGRVCSAASSLLQGLEDQPFQRQQALLSCLEMLEDEDVDTRVCGCKALTCLKAKESIDQLVYLCRTDKEEVRNAAKEALLALGEPGKQAHQRMEESQESIPRLFTSGSMASAAF